MVMKMAAYAVQGRARVVSGAADRTICVWDPEACSPALHGMDTHKHWVTALETFSGTTGEPRLASGCVDSTIYIWDPEAGGDPLRECLGHTDWICELRKVGTGPGGGESR